MKNILLHIRQSLSLKLCFGILLMAIPIFVVCIGFLFHQSKDRIKKEATERVACILTAKADKVRALLGIIETSTGINEWMIKDNMQPDSLLAISRRIVSINPTTNGCSITTEPNTFPEYGRYFSAYSVRKGDTIVTEKEKEYEYFEKPWYRIPKDLDEPCWIDPFYDDIETGTLAADELITSYCIPIHDDEGKILGVIATDLSLSRLTDTIQSEMPYPNAYYILLGKDGRYFVHPDSTKIINQTIFSDRDVQLQPEIIALGHEMTTGKNGTMRIFNNGEPCTVCYQTIEGTTWSIAIICPDSDILQGYYTLNKIILPTIIIGLIAILFLCYYIVTIAIKPLNRILILSQTISQGHYDVNVEKTDRRDVVGRLQNSFATMLTSLRNHVTDIQRMNTELEQRNNELKLANVRALDASRQKTIFIQNVTHQIRTPLNIILGFAQVIRDNGKDIPLDDMKSITDTMRHNAHILNRMVQMLYDSSETGITEELDNNRFEKVVCYEVAKQSIEHTKKHFPNIEINFESKLPEDYHFHTNKVYLFRSIRELLYNAAKYSDGKNISLKIEKNEKEIRFVVEDTGTGINKAYHDKVFIPFTKINDLSEGLGLGLPLAKRHINNLGGNLYIDPNYQKGCRFVVAFPC